MFESAHRCKDGTVFPVEINSRQITFERRTCILSVVRDITERRQAEEKLRAKEDLLRTIVDAIPAPVFYKNVQGAYIGCNQAFCDLFNLPKAEILIDQTVERYRGENHRREDQGTGGKISSAHR